VVDGALLLVREYRAAVGAHVLALPMGKVPDGADPAGAAAAELAEETGHRAGRIEPLGRLLACPGWMDQVVHAFRARECVALARRPASDDPDDVEEQHLSVVALPLDEITGAVARGDLCDARTLAVLYLAGDLNR
jgi:ADP-ribose pyrophosphatase